MLVCLRAASRIARTVSSNRVFCINVLRDGASALADRFAGRADLADRFNGVELIAGDLPLLAEASAAFRCRLIDSVEAGSHVIVLGQVLEVYTAPEPPLAYLDGRYASLTHHPPPSAAETLPCPSSA